MNETAPEYIARITGLVGDRDPWTILPETPARLQSLISQATPSELAWTTSSSRWSIAQIVAHLADAEIVGAWRVRSVLAEDGVILQAYDQNAWADAFGYADIDPAASVALFGALRNATVQLLRRTDPARREHAGQHQERGEESIGQIMRMYAGHDLNHMAQIELLLSEVRTVG